METIERLVEKTTLHRLPYEPTLLMPIGDVQLGAEASDEDRFRRHMEWGLEQGAYFLGMGDYVDVASPSNRQALRAVRLYDSVHEALEEQAEKARYRFLELVRRDGASESWLGLLEGHHFYEYRDGTTSDMRIAQALNTDFLGSCAFVRLVFPRGSTASVTCTIWAHHGVGSSSKVSGPLNRLETVMAHFDADIYLIGHHHKKVAAPIDQLYMTRKHPARIAHRTKLIACTGGFLKGYMMGSKQGVVPRGTYVEQAMLLPVELGGVVISITPGYDDHLDLRISL